MTTIPHATSIREIPVPGKWLCGLAWARGLLWFSDGELQEIFAVDPAAGEVVRRFPCAEVRTGLTAQNGRLLQVAGPARALRIIDLESGEVLDELPNPRAGAELCGIEASGDELWLGYKDPTLLDLRRRDGMALVTTLPVNENVAGVTVVGRLVAFANHPDSRITLLDPATKEVVARIGVDGKPTGMTFDGERIWYCDYAENKLRAVEVPAAARP